MHFSRWSWYIIFAGFLFLAFSIGIFITAEAQTEPPGPDMPPMPSGLDPPPTVYPPTQVSQGSVVYYLVCMACHGDKGQGLTNEWRGALDEPDQNCWQSRCHAANYPPGGFVFPKIVPALVSPGMLARFETAQDLYDYLKSEMPFQAAGSLSDAEYWQLSAYLLRINGVEIGSRNLDSETALRIPLRAAVVGSSEPPSSPRSMMVWAVVSGLSSVLVLVWVLWQRAKRTETP